MNKPTAGLALVVSDRIPPAQLGDVLSLSGYRVDIVHSCAAALRVVDCERPTLVVAGPIRSAAGLHDLLTSLRTRSIRMLVVSESAEVTALADSLGVPVRVLDAPVGEAWLEDVV